MYSLDKIRLIDWQMVEPEVLGGELCEDLGVLINRSIRYMLTKWWQSKGFDKDAREQYLSIKGTYDKVTRQAIYFAKTISLAIKFGLYDTSVVGVREFSARDKFIKVIRSCAVSHISNTPDGWGNSNDSIHGVYELVLASYVSWDKINKVDKEHVVNMLEYEIARLYEVNPLYSYTASGMMIDRAQATVFYNTAVANLLHLASIMMPYHDKIHVIKSQMQRFYSAIYAVKEDSNGIGFNVSDDGFITTFGEKSAIATSYIASISKALILTGFSMDSYADFVPKNFEDIYKAFYTTTYNEKDLPNGIFVSYDKKGKPISKISYSESTKLSEALEGQVYLMDILAFCFGLEDCIPVGSREWAKVRMRALLHRQKGLSAKYCMYSPQFEKFLHGECVVSSLIDAYVLLFFYATKKSSELSNKDKVVIE